MVVKAIDWPVKDVYVKYVIRQDLAFQRNQQRQRYFSHTYGVVDRADTKSHSQQGAGLIRASEKIKRGPKPGPIRFHNSD